jgi:hypothetical protein
MGEIEIIKVGRVRSQRANNIMAVSIANIAKYLSILQSISASVSIYKWKSSK